MPKYTYHCDGCAHAFERTETISEHEKAGPQCANCKGKKVSVVPNRVNVVTTKKS
jgi:putative FmdB family regulatory protein